MYIENFSKGADFMRLDRAEEILNSADNIKVLYHDSPVWIESISENDQTAHVKVLNTQSHIDVALNDLTEKS